MMTSAGSSTKSSTIRAGSRGRAGAAVASRPRRASWRALAVAVAAVLVAAWSSLPAAAAAAADGRQPQGTPLAPPHSHPHPHRRALRQQSGFYHRVSDLAWRNTDFSVRNEQQSHMVLSAMRRTGGDAHQAAAVSTALLGSQNFERRADTHSRNNLMMNLARYAKPGQSGALGAVYRRIHPRTFVTGDKDTDFRNNAWAAVHLKEVRGAQMRGDREASLGRARQAALERSKRELADRAPPPPPPPAAEPQAGEKAAAAAGR